MKKIILFSFCLLALMGGPYSLSAQGPRHGKEVKVEEMVSGLSLSQKKKLLQVQEQSHERIGQLKAELGEVRDSIRTLMRRDGDNSRVLYPLFDREGALQAQIAKEMYAMRIRIDAILTPEQLQELRQAMEKRRRCKKG